MKKQGNYPDNFFPLESYNDVILREFHINLPDKENAKIAWYHLRRECQLFVNYCHYNLLIQQDESAVLKKKFIDFILLEDSSESFDKAVEICLKRIGDSDTEKKVHIQKNHKRFHKNYCDLLSNPTSMNHEDLVGFLLTLCRLNAFYSLKTIFTIHKNLGIKHQPLLRQAIGCLHTETLDVLINFGADIHQYTIHSNYAGEGFQWFCSPLLFAFLLPMDLYCAIGIIAPGKLTWDNEKLNNMLEFLMEKGANPAQKSIMTEPDLQILSLSKSREGGPDCISMAKEFLGQFNSPESSPEYLLFKKFADMESEPKNAFPGFGC